MITVRLWGGLGNQMFQYAFGYAVAKEKNTELFLDTRFYTRDFLASHPYFSKQEANILEFPLEFRKQVNLENEYRVINFFQNRTISRIIRIPNRFSFPADDGIRYIKETRLRVYPNIVTESKINSYFDGYWQSEQYFKQYKTALIKQFTIHSLAIDKELANHPFLENNAVSIHLRLGDYISKKRKISQYNYIISPNYYLSAMDLIASKIEQPCFYVFSNNVAKARELLGNKYKYVVINEDRHLSDIEEFTIMSKCKHHIISNSTFSWWAAWINDNGFTIAPDIFFGNEAIIPENWERCKFEEQ